MRVRMLNGMAGPSLNYVAGQEVEMHNNEAMRLIAAGAAEPIHNPPTEKQWELRIGPARYLELYPEGPNADLAHQLVEQGQEN